MILDCALKEIGILSWSIHIHTHTHAHAFNSIFYAGVGCMVSWGSVLENDSAPSPTIITCRAPVQNLGILFWIKLRKDTGIKDNGILGLNDVVKKEYECTTVKGCWKWKMHDRELANQDDIVSGTIRTLKLGKAAGLKRSLGKLLI